ncbi:MAG: hypothetical protein NVSMB55_08950 [Mycobacteriales bacterium]
MPEHVWGAAGPHGRGRLEPPLPDLLLTGLGRGLWWWRLELALLAVPSGLGWWLATRVSLPAGIVVAIGLVVAALALRPPRALLLRALRSARARRRWYRGVRAAALPALAGQFPQVRSARPVPAGDLLTVLVPPGCKSADLEAGAEELAAALAVRELRVARDRANAQLASVLVVRRDPFQAPEPVTWPAVQAPSMSLWQPVPAGLDEAGEEVGVLLPERHVLLGGEPGAGKSAALSLLVAAAALDPAVDLWLLDGKLVELATWAGVARFSVGPDIDEAVDVLRVLQREMDARYAALLANRARKVSPESGLRLQVVVCDELAFYLHVGERKARAEFAELMRDLVARGRAAGLVVLAATQKPSVDIVPSALRDLFGFRWALRCSTPQASDTILGQGWASQGFTAADVDAGQRGVGLLLHEGGVPVRCRSFYLDDDQLEQISRRAELLRQPAPPVPLDGGVL